MGLSRSRARVPLVLPSLSYERGRRHVGSGRSYAYTLQAVEVGNASAGDVSMSRLRAVAADSVGPHTRA